MTVNLKNIGSVHITDTEILFLHKIMFWCAVMWYITNKYRKDWPCICLKIEYGKVTVLNCSKLKKPSAYL